MFVGLRLGRMFLIFENGWSIGLKDVAYTAGHDLRKIRCEAEAAFSTILLNIQIFALDYLACQSKHVMI